MTCRSTSTTPTLPCWNGNDGGQQMGYDALRRLIAWQNAPGASPTASEQYAYDGDGTRVGQQAQSVSGSPSTTTTTDTVYALGSDETTTTSVTGQSSTTTNVRTYPLPGGALAERDATGLYYLATDHLGTPIATLRLDDGTLTGTQLRTPYGQARYSSAANTNEGMHSSFGFTGQREDTQAWAPGSSGLDYFNARYYDPLVGRFTSADDVVGSDPLLDGYAYVGGRVESATDPSGHDALVMDPVYTEDGPPDLPGYEDGPPGAAPPGSAGDTIVTETTSTGTTVYTQDPTTGYLTVTQYDTQGTWQMTQGLVANSFGYVGFENAMQAGANQEAAQEAARRAEMASLKAYQAAYYKAHHPPPSTPSPPTDRDGHGDRHGHGHGDRTGHTGGADRFRQLRPEPACPAAHGHRQLRLRWWRRGKQRFQPQGAPVHPALACGAAARTYRY